MRFLTCVFAGLPIVSAAALLVATPALAKKKVAAGPVIAMSDAFRANVAAAQAALQSRDVATASARIMALAPMSDIENYVAAGLRFELAAQRGDVQAQRIALTDLFKTNELPKKDAPRLRYVAGYLSYAVGNYDDAVAQLDYAKTLGYDGIDALLLRADIALRRNKPKEARPFVQQALARQRASGQPVPLAWSDRASRDRARRTPHTAVCPCTTSWGGGCQNSKKARAR